MEYTELDFETLDIDWFAIDTNFNIAHFTTGGGRSIPKMAALSKEMNKLCFKYFSSLADISNSINLKKIEKFTSFSSNTEKEEYFDAFSFVYKGLFSYDAVIDLDGNLKYCCINKPSFPLSAKEIDLEIKKYLGVYAYKGTFDASDELFENSFDML